MRNESGDEGGPPRARTLPVLGAWLLGLLTVAGYPARAIDLVRLNPADKPDHVILYIIDGLSYKTWDRVELPTLSKLIEDGALVEQSFLPPSEHPIQGPYAELHSCSIPNPVMMAGTLFLDKRTVYFPENIFPDKTTAFVANTTNYSSLDRGYHYSYQKLGPDPEGLSMAVTFMKLGRPVFMRLHLQEVGEASYQILFVKDNVPWRRNIWAEGSPYVDYLRKADAQLAGFIEELGSQEVLERTALIIMGDHGEADTGYHPPESFDAAITTMVLWGSGIKRGVRIPYAEQMDVVPTICALLGIDPPSTSQGRIIGEALAKPIADLPPRRTLLRDLLLQLDGFRSAETEASYRLSCLSARNSPESTRLYRECGNIRMDFYGIDKFVEWPRFGRIESLLKGNADALARMTALLKELRSIPGGES